MANATIQVKTKLSWHFRFVLWLLHKLENKTAVKIYIGGKLMDKLKFKDL